MSGEAMLVSLTVLPANGLGLLISSFSLLLPLSGGANSDTARLLVNSHDSAMCNHLRHNFRCRLPIFDNDIELAETGSSRLPRFVGSEGLTPSGAVGPLAISILTTWMRDSVLFQGSVL